MKWTKWIKGLARKTAAEFDWWSFAAVLVASAIGGFIGLTIALHGGR